MPEGFTVMLSDPPPILRPADIAPGRKAQESPAQSPTGSNNPPAVMSPVVSPVSPVMSSMSPVMSPVSPMSQQLVPQQPSSQPSQQPSQPKSGKLASCRGKFYMLRHGTNYFLLQTPCCKLMR